MKNDDPRIYDEKVKFFSDKPDTSKDVESEGKSKKPKKERAVFLRDYERKMILENDGRISGEDEDDTKQKPSSTTTYIEEQRQLKDSFKWAFEDEDDDEDTSFLKTEKVAIEEKHTVCVC